MYPLDPQVFSNVSFPLSEQMVFLMEMPGAIIMGMSKQQWARSGAEVFRKSFDTYVVVFDLEEKVFHSKMPGEPLGLPRSFAKLLRRSLSSLDLNQSDLYVSF